MTDETRRSGRANKGQHTKLPDLLDEPAAPKTKAQPKADKKGHSKGKPDIPRPQSIQPPEEQSDEEEDDAIIRCVCGDQRDIRGRQMICCDKCEAWQHNKCLALPEGDFWEGKNYYCEQCKPEDHQDLLAAMARGEKPWARKKGSKGNKPRPSDVRIDDNKPRTPQPSVSGPASPAVAPPVLQPTPAPAPAAPTVDQTQDAPSNLDTESKAGSQPQSPIGEKRRHDGPAEKTNAKKKRRKSSSQQQDKASPQTRSLGSDMDSLPATQKLLAEKLRDVLFPLIKTASDARGYRIPDGETAKSLGSRLAVEINAAAVAHYGEPIASDSPSSLRLRTIMFNVKQNVILIDRLLSGSLKPQELASMPTEEMASENKQREFAAMREAAEKQMILTEEPGPRLRKTHKGEEVVGEDNFDSHEFKQPTLQHRDSVAEDAPMESPMSHRPPESPADAAHPLSAETTGTPTDSVRRPSANFDLNAVFDKVRSPKQDQQAFMPRRQSSLHNQEKTQTSVDDADVDRLLKEEENDVEMTGYSVDPTVCWQGSISMQSTQAFDAVARFVAGGDFGQVMPWNKLLANVLYVQGRIESSKGDDYIRSIGHSETCDVAVLALSPVTTEGRGVMDHFYQYFQSRGRWGVVPVEGSGSSIMRDLYIIPIEAGGSNLPPFIDMLEYCTIETPRKEHMVLLALVAQLPEVKPEQSPTDHSERLPAQNTTTHQVHQPAGPSPSPVTHNPHAPQPSPMVPSFPPAQHAQYQPPQYFSPTAAPPAHHQIPRALEIMGPYIDAPVITRILNSGQAISELQMINLRHIVEANPEARTDFIVFKNLLMRNGNGSQQQAQGQQA